MFVYDQAGITPADLRMIRLIQIKERKQAMCSIAEASDALEHERTDPKGPHCKALLHAVDCGNAGYLPDLSDVLDLHQRVFEWGGALRMTNVTIAGSKHRPADYRALATLLKQWEGNLKWYVEQGHDPLYVLAVSHLEFENIHPFQDGNGRIGRLLLNWLSSYFNVGLIKLTPEVRNQYLDALENKNVSALITLLKQAIV